MDINGNTLNAFRADLNAALAPLQEKYNVTITLGRITYGAEEFSGKLSVVNGRDPDEVERNRFDENVWKYEHLGLKKGMFNRIFIGLDGERYAIRGFNTKSHKYPIEYMRVSNGERRRCSEWFIKKLLPEYFINSEMSVTILDE